MNKKLIFAAVTVLFFAACTDSAKEILIPRAAIQKIADSIFPYEKNLLLASFKLQSPQIYFQGQYVGMKLQYYGNFLNKEVKGEAVLYGQILYKPSEGAFYVSNFQVADVTIDRPDIVSRERVKEYMTTLAGSYLKEYPVYRLNPNDYKQNLAKMLLKNIGIRGDNIVLNLGIP